MIKNILMCTLICGGWLFSQTVNDLDEEVVKRVITSDSELKEDTEGAYNIEINNDEGEPYLVLTRSIKVINYMGDAELNSIIIKPNAIIVANLFDKDESVIMGAEKDKINNEDIEDFEPGKYGAAQNNQGELIVVSEDQKMIQYKIVDINAQTIIQSTTIQPTKRITINIIGYKPTQHYIQIVFDNGAVGRKAFTPR